MTAPLGVPPPGTIMDAAPEAPSPSQPSSVSRRRFLSAAAIAALVAAAGPVVGQASSARADWGPYPNGQIPPEVLVPISWDTRHRLRKDACAAIERLNAAFRAAFGRNLPVNDGYRDLAGQQRAWDAYQAGGNLAERVGKSKHGWAIAVDFGGEIYSSSSSPSHRWLQANAGAYQWAWTGRYFSQIENWHWEYTGDYTAPTETTATENNVEAIVKVPNGTVVHLRYGGKTDFASQQQYNDFRMQVNTLRDLGATDVMPLPELSKVPGVTWDTFTFLAGYIGAPTA
ncbi:D-alanyl-D-alanine carboxypeptidase family protein [Microbacterium maritypicum]|uniref:M15 family metallopeptidase n=1 Tax=Microbacterium maritypicum TaxID=33918 RepID=UPI00382B7EC7